MAPKTLESSLGTPIHVGICAPCALLWFDRAHSSRLGTASVLELFKTLGVGAPKRELRAAFSCASCSAPLALTHDVQRTTHFSYWRCAADHSQLITYTQFLLEKNFVRPPSPEELARLREIVREIACSHCGAPIDLKTDSSCPYCHAAIALIDPDSVAKAVRDLDAASHRDTAAAASAVQAAQIQAIFDQERIDRSGGRHDLLDIGVTAIGQLLRHLAQRP